MPSLFREIFSSRALFLTFFFGISSGLPFSAADSTFKAYLQEEGFSLAAIGLLGWLQLPYSIKILWAPLIDRFSLPFLTRRRGWIFFSQLILALALAALGILDIGHSVFNLIVLAALVTFFSATQDIALDAHRRDTLKPKEFGLGSSLFIAGYRVGMLLSGAAALALADLWGWKWSYLCLAFLMGCCCIFTLLAKEPEVQDPPRTLQQSVKEPFLDFFKQTNPWLILSFILLYKIGDGLASSLTLPFYLQHGYSKTEIAAVVKLFGFSATIAGAILGGFILLRLRLVPCLFYFGILQALSTLGFAILAHYPADNTLLAAVIAFENITAGLGTAAYASYMAGLCNTRFSATQYALLSSVMGIPRTFFGSFNGFLVETSGWESYFLICTVLAIPGLLLIRFLPPPDQDKQSSIS